MAFNSKNEDNFPFGLNALLLAIEEIERTLSKKEHRESSDLNCKTRDEETHIDPEKSHTENESNNNDKCSFGSGNSTENSLPLGLQAFLAANDETEVTKPINQNMERNSISCPDNIASFIEPTISSLESPAAKKSPDLDISEVGSHSEKNTSTSHSIYKSPITPKIQSSKQNESYQFNNPSEKSDFSTLQIVSNYENDKQTCCDLKCSECGDNVELLNQDPTFSMVVHMQSHRIVEDSDDFGREFKCDMSVDYMCPDCNKMITVFNNDIDFSFERHFSSCPKSDTRTTPEEKIKLNKKFVDEVFSFLGNAFKTDYPYVVFEGSELYCKACKCSISTSICNIFDTSVSLRSHLSLLFHKDLVTVLNGPEKDMNQYDGSTNRKLCAEKHNIFVSDRSLYCSSDKLVSKTPLDQIQKLATEPKFAPHVKYLKVIGRTCRCLLCDVTLCVSIKVNHNLKQHILGKHMKIYEKLHSGVHEGVKTFGEASSSSPIQKSDKLGLSPVSNPLIVAMGKRYYCSLCNATLLSVSIITEHLKGAKHQKQCRKLKLLNQSCSKQDISQPIKLSPNSTSESLPSPHIIALRLLAKDPRCAPHLEYLQFNNNLCNCSICSASVPIEKGGFLQHILGAKHKKRFEKLQIGSSHSQKISDQNIQSTQILAEFRKLAQDPSCAPQLKYIKKVKNQYHCSICKVNIPSGKKNIKEHLIGAKHMKHLKSEQ